MNRFREAITIYRHLNNVELAVKAEGEAARSEYQLKRIADFKASIPFSPFFR